MDKRKKFYLTIDTETYGTTMEPTMYDIGGIVHDSKGQIQESFSFLIEETFLDLQNMQTTYYFNKYPQYVKDLAKGSRKLVSIAYAYSYIRELMAKYNIKTVIAYNMAFDYRSTNGTLRKLTNFDYKYFFPKGTEFWDSMKMAQDTICKQKGYEKFCRENGFLTNHKTPRIQTKAETVYRFITKNPNFVEEHRGLQDCEIEVKIFVECLKKHKKMRRLCWSK